MSQPSRSAVSSRAPSSHNGAAFDFDVVTDLRPIPSRPPAPAEGGTAREKPAENTAEKAVVERR